MKRTIFILVTALFIISITSCSQYDKTSNVNAENDKLENKIKTPTLFGINGEDIYLRVGPGNKFDKIINEKGTEAIGETQYCSVDYSTKVAILETKDEWTKIKVIEPEWLSDTYIGWIPSNNLISENEQEKESLGKLDKTEFEILKTDHNSAVQNFHVLLKRKDFDKNYVYQFIKAFRKENCTKNCNVNLYDSKSIEKLIGLYALNDKDYLKMADHLISASTFDATEVRYWYPFQDFHYKEIGGTNWKK